MAGEQRHVRVGGLDDHLEAPREARLDGIFVKLKLFGVDYVQLSGVAPTGAAVQEKLSV